MRIVLGITAPITVALGIAFLGVHAAAEDPWVVYDNFDGPGDGKHVVLITGEELYRSEEAFPQLGKILAQRHGFTCTVLFPVDPDTGTINPNVNDNIPGLEALETADLMIFYTRYRNLPEEQMAHIDAYLESGRPVIGMRTSVAAFDLPEDHAYHHYTFDSEAEGWEGGFGQRILGETWIANQGAAGSEGTRGVIVEDQADHPILRGVSDIFGPTQTYEVRLPLPGGGTPLLLGEVVDGTDPDDPPVEGEKNDPMMPVAWTGTYAAPGGGEGRVFTTTMGDATDFVKEDFRRLLVNAAYWAVGLEEEIPAEANVAIVGEFDPSTWGFDGFIEGVTRSDHAL